MQDSGIPAKFPIPFANSAGGSYIRTVPEASQIGIQNGAASLTDGFPPLCFVPIASGGSWPFGQDFNGLLKQVTQWLQWMQAGGPIYYDATFSSEIGGYPNGTILQSAGTAGQFWVSLVDNNTSDPDTGGANWRKCFPPGSLVGVQVFTASGTYTPNALATNAIIEVLGGGGGGGGCSTTTSGANGAGAPGNAGAYAKHHQTTLASETITIGAGGAGNVGGTGSGSTGGTSSFGSIVVCQGGAGGNSPNTTPGYASGNPGSALVTAGGNLAAVPGAPGVAGLSISASFIISGQGASSPYGSGGAAINGNSNGNNATGYGAGGGGCAQEVSQGTARNGGNGSPGYIIIYEFS